MNLNTCPSFAISNKSNFASRHIRNNGKCMGGYSLTKQFPNVNNLFGG